MQKNKLIPFIVIRSCIFWLLAVAALPVYNVVMLFIWPLNRQQKHRIINSSVRYFSFLLQHVAGVKHQVSGLENIPDKPALIVSNHQSAWETITFNCIFPPIVWIMKKEILSIPLFGWGARMCSPIAIDRSRGEDALVQVIEQGNERFRQGFWICIFPEGTRVKPKARKPFKYGAAKLAIKMEAPIIPVAHNAGYCLPKNSFWFYPGTVKVIIGKPIYPEENDPTELTKKIETWINTLLESIGS